MSSKRNVRPMMMDTGGRDFSALELAGTVRSGYGSGNLVTPGSQYITNQAPPALQQTINPGMAKPGPHVYHSMYVPSAPTVPSVPVTPVAISQPVTISPPT